jgi:hypothetical protein
MAPLMAETGLKQFAAGRREGVSVHADLQMRIIDDRFFWGQNLCIVFHDCSPISLIAINEIRLQSIIFIQVLSSILAFPPNPQLFQGEVIHATRCRRTGPIRTHRFCWASFSRPVMEIEIVLSGNYLQHNVVYLEI